MSVATTVPATPSNDSGNESLTAVLQVEVVALPAYLDNTDILLRHGPYRLESMPTGHWGERLSLGITHALAADLAEKLPQYRVVVYRSARSGTLLLRVNVNSFDVFPDGHCVLVADWALVEKSGTSAPVLGAGTYVIPPLTSVHPDVSALVGAMSVAVTRLAEGVVATL